ncbi:hypothetical protein CPB86DRAFT_814229 [Serendipita vermifera]|nr:hypothetical protein CPB86DRAFT_814229 [Serendipita vermifera]
MAPSGESQREAKSRRTGEPGTMSAPGQSQQGNSSRATATSGDAMGEGLGAYSSQAGMSSQVHSILADDAYGQRHGGKREDLVDQKLMDELKRELGDPLMAQTTAPTNVATALSPPSST